MPAIILLGIFAVWGAVNLCENSTPNSRTYTSREMENLLGEMTGKSQRECRAILRKYR